MHDTEKIIADKINANQPITTEEAERFIIDVPARTESTIFRGDEGFKRSQAFLALLGNPQNTNTTIHIAGTSGKGSVAALVTNLLLAHGKRVGMYSSPHVYSLRERWQINGVPVSGELPRAIPKLYDAIKNMENTQWGRPTYFEITTALGFMLFENQVDYSVIETGMGGLYDTTNAITRTDKLGVITELGLDHTQILGETLGEIAYQKAGILPKNGDAVVLEPEDPDAQHTIVSVANERDCRVQYVTGNTYQALDVSITQTSFSYTSPGLQLDNLAVSLIGKHQVKNAAIALKVLEFLSTRDGFALDEVAIRHALTNTHLPGRFEKRTVQGKLCIFDGAHNPQKLGALAAILHEALPNQKFTWVMALGKNKDALDSFKLLAPCVETLYITSFFANQDMPLSSKAAEVYELATTARTAGITNIVVEPDNKQALTQALKTAQNIPVIVAGSFYLLGDII